jgi:tetratricopeptide (TPR) repeat protein
MRTPDRAADAEHAYRCAIAAGDGRAAFELGMLLVSQGDRAGALFAYDAAVGSGDSRAWNLLVAVLSIEEAGFDMAALQAVPRDVAPELEESLRDAIADGEDEAYADLGQLLSLQGRHDEAEACFRSAAQAGHFDALLSVAMLNGARGRMVEAEQALRLAALAGNANAQLLLGALLTRTDPEQAEAAYRAAIDGGLSNGWCGLALVLRDQPGREADYHEARLQSEWE